MRSTLINKYARERKIIVEIRRGRRGGRLDDGSIVYIMICIIEEIVYRRFLIFLFINSDDDGRTSSKAESLRQIITRGK